MSKEMVISVNPHETRVAILEEGQLCEYYVEREREFALVGSIYKGRVTRVLPGMQSAFVEIGLDSDAFLYVSDFMEEVDDLDTVVSTAEEKIQKIEDQGGHAFAEGQPAAAPVMEPADVEPVSEAEVTATAPASVQESGHIEPLPGESLSPAAPGETRTAPPSFGHGRPRFDDRGRGGFGGRDSGRFGRGRGRGGRFGRRGRGGDRGDRGDRHHHGGRDLPSSKYASPGSHDDRPAEPMPEGYTPIILPGESLAKYRERPALEPTATSSEGEPISASAGSDVLDAVRHDVESARGGAPAFPHEPPHPAEQTGKESTSFADRRSLSGVEPLPGESISKWRGPDASMSDAVAAFTSPEAPTIEEHRDEMEPAIHEAEEASEESEEEDSPDMSSESDDAADAEDVSDLQSNDHVIAHLSAEEAAAHAQNVAEMQVQHGDDLPEEDEHDIDTFAEAALEEAHEDALADEAQEHAEGHAEADDDEEQAEPHEIDAEAEVRESLLAYDTAEEPEPLAAEGAPEGSSQSDQQPWKATVRGDFRARMQHPNRRGGRDRGGRRQDRGRRPRHGHAPGRHGQQPRRPQLISELLKQGQEIIVQIAKEPLGKKGARITSHVALPGRYLVYMPTLHHTGVSRKIASAEERSRLRHLVNDAKGTAGGGFIVRTAASSAPPEDVRADVEFLTRTWSEIKARSEQRKAPSLLHRDLNLVERILRDFVNSDFGAVWVDSEEDFTKVVEFMGRFQPALVSRVKLYTKETPIFEEFGIQQEIDKGLRPKVWLKSGGYIVINHTEALVAIDVNTGKFVGKGSNRLEDTIVRTNLEAVKEIVRQMRLRDLGGIIVIDFIDMEERRNREKVMAALEDALRADRAPSKVLRFNEFGLVAITRKRTKQALERTLCQPCPYCAGSGMVKSVPTLCYEIQAEAKKMAPEMDAASITLRVNPEISKALKTRESSLIEELERWTKKSVIIQADAALHWEQYDIY
ncbi:MAG TPA: Rne/Rng family ribonuclease [Candidatus Acidoferrales bacterium]|nr:Rne/Rng family ribonuclease [Candidatus Acidoferrales bacterium]